MIWTAAFWRATLERAISSAAQGAVASWGTSALPDVSMPWWTIPATAAAMFVLSILKGIGAAAATGGGPSLTNAETIER